MNGKLLFELLEQAPSYEGRKREQAYYERVTLNTAWMDGLGRLGLWIGHAAGKWVGSLAASRHPRHELRTLH